MVGMKAELLFVLLVSAAAASPFAAPLGGRKLLCAIDGEEVPFAENIARQVVKKAPSGTHDDSPSGYPTTFENKEELDWQNEDCDPTDLELLQFPILENGEEYEWDKEPKQDPGPCRVAYGASDKQYCGVMCHKTRSDESSNNPYTKCKIA